MARGRKKGIGNRPKGTEHPLADRLMTSGMYESYDRRCAAWDNREVIRLAKKLVKNDGK